MKVKDVIQAIIEDSQCRFELPQTCDKLMSGDPEMEVKGVVTSFMATADVIRSAAKCGANMIVTHEPTFFTGADTTEWLQGDPVYDAKKKLLDETGMAVWRYHDHMHIAKTDRIYDGLLEELGWEKYLMPDQPAPHCYEIPETTLGELAAFFKKRLSMDVIQLIGDPSMKCGRVGILVGGGSLGLGREEMPMQLMNKQNLDVIVCGDITEWTLPAYVNDAHQLGFNRALLIVGHERSEEWGMKHMAKWLPKLLPGIPVSFVDAREPFSYL